MVRVLKIAAIAIAFAATVASHHAIAQAPAPIPSAGSRILPVIAQNGMVSSQEARASRIGMEILKRGGNAVDAAVAVGFALAVTLPQAGNLGGGGFMLVHLAAKNETIAIDYRETAPAAATREMFLDAEGNADPRKSRDTGLSVGVPGTVAGLTYAHAKYGSGQLTLAELIAPAIRLAREGIPVEEDLADSLPRARYRLAPWPSTAKIFLKPDGSDFGAGDTLVQTDLAETLTTIARGGAGAFYTGQTAARIVAAVRAAGGIMTEEDLAKYRAVERPVVRGTYRGYDIASMPPPSSGGIHVIQILNLLEGFDLKAGGAGSAATLHLMIEAMKLAYADRAEFLGDPDFVKVPVRGLTSKKYAETLRASINPERARPAQEIKPGNPAPYESDQTTHYSVVDKDGNAVANTYTLNFSYGLGLVADQTGIILNNELDDFAAKAGVPNAYGLVGGDANAPGPNKRPLSSMSPTIVTKDGKVFLVTGSPGGSRIITTVLQVILNTIDHGMNIAEAVQAPRLHHQWAPDEVFAERGFSPDTLALLQSRGHRIRVGNTTGSASSIVVLPKGFAGASDLRQRGTLAIGF
ncbi:gamma-glutamyltranspeptidase precursor [Variibacter gotjawalensis]|uniref:Glutathione hydrolase proenzyme n=1 Tax=Variibacter gotjawalensis TaxID=1333996 RepID=A0A0S3PQ88_9BRAD|nr:gamma-glutamyltransferase [Variibacter gotjawalensis]NIK48445.1 gamma-glutamyltranspeptidase/glutathione hydrolase [Variibacter gotjawalensis]RZS50312.1 gamma-glutamyltranspeptidase/glutathione hydrolase [Variibacter gotjawalensis]BAT58145.1 gamma-glutamyltranspeptidase precursor [Variibacter gotjawalensis]